MAVWKVAGKQQHCGALRRLVQGLPTLCGDSVFVCAEPKRVTSMSDVARARGLAAHRRERRLRAFWRHEIMSVKMATNSANHHSAQRQNCTVFRHWYANVYLDLHGLGEKKSWRLSVWKRVAHTCFHPCYTFSSDSPRGADTYSDWIWDALPLWSSARRPHDSLVHLLQWSNTSLLHLMTPLHPTVIFVFWWIRNFVLLVNRTPSHIIFSRVSLHLFHCRTWHLLKAQGSRLSASRHPCFMRSVCFDLSSTLHFALFTVSLIFLFILLIFIFIFHVGWFGEKYPVRFREWGVRHFGRQQSSHRLWAQRARQLPDLRDHWNFHPGVLQRQQLELAWLGNQWQHHRQSALFTTVHSGARRSSEPWTSLSLSWRRLVVKSVVVCRSCWNRETCFQRVWITNFQTSEKIRVATQKMSKFFWNDKKSRFSLIIEQRFKNISSKPTVTEEISKNWMELSSLNEVRLIVLFKETNSFDINNFFMKN